MTIREIIEANEEAIKEELISSYTKAVECDGRIERQIYIWSDGEIEVLEEAQGSNSWLRANNSEDRDLYYLTTVTGCNVWDNGEPEDEAEAEKEHDLLVDILVDDYKAYIDVTFEHIIEDVERREN